MNRRTRVGVTFGLNVILAVVVAATSHALSPAFTYQGQLRQSGVPANGTCDLRVGLYDEAAGGTQIGATELHTGVAVQNGLFSVALNEPGTFGVSAFDGADRWLQVDVRCPTGTGSFTTLAPRQQLTASPYALWAPSAGTADDLACAGCVGSNDLASGAVTSAQIAAGTIQQSDLAFTPGSVTSITAGSGLTGGTITTSGTIAANIGTGSGTLAAGNHAHEGTYWALGGNTGTSYLNNSIGTTDNQALDLKVFGSRALRLEPRGSPNLIGGWGGNTVVPPAVGATIGGGGGPDDGAGGPAPNRVTDDYGTVSGGLSNQAGSDSTEAPYATVGGGQRNGASAAYATVGGGRRNSARGGYATIGGGSLNQAGDGATIGGGDKNIATGLAATLGGGVINRALGSYATVGGGLANRAEGAYASIAGGGPSDPADTTTGNAVFDDYGTIGGGGLNRAGSDDGDPQRAGFATVSGGGGNSATGFAATIGGGGGNRADGWHATVPGGEDNTAAGNYSFAAGRRAKAYNQGCFVLADATDADEPCYDDNRFVFRVTNAFFIWTTADHSIGTVLPRGGNAWAPISDRKAKENFTPVDGQDVLARLATVPIETWNLKSQHDSIRHIGPMAQDFSAAFGVGEDDTHISTVDADGVALAAIKGLYHLIQQKDAQIAALQARLTALEATHE